MNDSRFVAPAPVNVRREPVNFNVSAVTGEVIQVGQSLAVQDGATEQTSGMDRSKAWVVRMAAYSVINLILAVTLVNIAGGGWVLAFCLFAGTSLVLFAVMDKREYTYSRNGLERHKVDALTDLKELELVQNHELRLLALRYMIDSKGGGGYAAITDEDREADERTIVGVARRRITSAD